MSTSFPTSIDNFTDPQATDDTSLVPHDLQHAGANDAITAIETKLGSGASTPTAGTILRGTGTGTTAYGQVNVSTDVAAFSSANLRALLSDETGTGSAVFGTSPTIATPTLTIPVIADFTSATHTHANTAGGGTLGSSAFQDASVLSRNLKPTYGRLQATSNLTLSTALQDIPGCTVTFSPATASNVLVWGVFAANGNSAVTAGDLMQGALVVDGTAQGSSATFVFSTITARATVTQVWLIALSAASHTIKLQAQNINHSTGLIDTVHTSMTYLVLSQ